MAESNPGHGHADARVKPANCFFVQRPAVYAGEAGFFENDDVQALLDGANTDANLVRSPHITIGQARFSREVMAEYPDASLQTNMNRCRRVAANGWFPDGYQGHARSVVLAGSRSAPSVAVALDLFTVQRRVRRDAELFHEFFGISFDEGNISALMTLAKFFDATKAHDLRENLNQVITEAERPADIAVGGLMVVAGAKS